MRHGLTLLLLLSLVPSPSFARARPQPPTDPRPAPAFDLPGRAGSVSLASLQGKVLYVDFWASWCEPCRRSFPWLEAMQRRYGPRGLVIVAVNLDKDRAAADAFLEKYHPSFIVAFDPSGATAEAFRVTAMPSSFLIGPRGTILHARAGFDPRRVEAVEALIAEACTP